MGTLLWRGDAAPVAQVSSATITAYDAATTYAVTIGNKSVSVVGQGGTAATTAAALLAALQASTLPEFLEVTWTNPSGAIITGTAATAGVPFTTTSSAASGTGTFGSFSTTTTSSGPNDLNVAANYSTGALPVNGDDLYFIQSSSSVLYNLSALSGVVLNSLNIDSTFTGYIGLPRYNNGSAGATGGISTATNYLEYRATYLAIGPGTLNVGLGTGSGSGRLKINYGSNNTTTNVYSTGSPADNGLPALILKGTGTNTLNVLDGVVGVAVEAGDTSSFTTINVGYLTQKATDVTLTLSSGVTLGTITQNGGNLTVQSNVTTWTMNGGTSTLLKTATVTTLDVEQGTLYYESSGTCTTATVGENGTIDFSRDPRSRTFTNTTVYGTWLDPNKSVTWTNAASFPNGIQPGNQGGAVVSLGTAMHLQRS